MKYAIDCVGGAVGTELYNSLGSGGVLISYGFLSREPISVDPLGLVAKVM